MDELLQDLDPQQREAVTRIGGALLVLAGPGSGKTRVITRRIAFRIACGSSPGRLLGITFTNRAADEMKRRVEHLVPEAVDLRLGTFHWMCHAILRRYGSRLGLRHGFRLLSPAESKRALNESAGADNRLRPANLST